MSLKAQLAEFKLTFDPKIESYIQNQIAKASAINPAATKSLQYFKKLVLAPGKRIRPALAYFGFLMGINTSQSLQSNQENILKLGISLEIFHTFALIHDDIIDESLVRRGEPTMEALYQKDFIENPKSSHFGLSGAILGGDYGLIICNQLINEIPYPKLRELYYLMQFELAAGQIDDCLGVGLGSIEKLQEKDILNMLRNKSGNYTIQKPALMGLTLASEASVVDNFEKKKTALTLAGEKIGLVYQLTDDIISLFGDEKETGKSNISDILEGKKTILVVRTYHRSSPNERIEIQKILGNSEATTEQINWLKHLILEVGVKDELLQECRVLINEANLILTSTFEATNPGVKFISELGQYLLERKS